MNEQGSKSYRASILCCRNDRTVVFSNSGAFGYNLFPSPDHNRSGNLPGSISYQVLYNTAINHQGDLALLPDDVLPVCSGNKSRLHRARGP